ncbi:MAG: recombinase family protein [Saprospiraceae bacterium]|nr:recombinase family protein [Saprospiraceae bacterium]MCF8252448.1 recombinase family protein [Saprospiraceae bacterium]MCF8282295.1 recombinase family protein [Bacteroidales bacterium]MCF8314026.1 recombinase family protein [Saprospiraceae bacterium]MCF8442778.1 recombinase family protein [Saprospiraceae bacterium]
MKKVYGYIRVSTVKQGTGVSLQEQREAIIRYAEKNELHIVEWFEELETAAKHGRPHFSRMMKLLQNGKANGVIIHKIDRSARNLRDWASLGDLIDKGVDVYFAHESLDMDTRGGRLAADIQAVIASDYIRNLRDETIKGLYGRLKQGIYPFGAPIGYVDNGGGKVKTIGKVQGPLVKKAFQLYASGRYSLDTLTQAMRELGLRNSKGNFLSLQTIAKILNNPFYTGVLKVKGRTFQGLHEPLVSSKLFTEVQNILRGKTNSRHIKHDFIFRRLVKCAVCGYSLIGERQKGIVYYRCHSKECPIKSIREDVIETTLLQSFERIQLHQVESKILDELLEEAQESWSVNEKGVEESIRMQKSRISQKQERLTEAYIENAIEKDFFEEKKEMLLVELQGLRHKTSQISGQRDAIFSKAKNFLELIKSVKNSYLSAITEEKRKIMKIVTSNLSIQEKNLMIAMRSPFYEIANRLDFLTCDLVRSIPRTSTEENANPATLRPEPVDSPELRAKMQELLDFILQYFEDNPPKEDDKEEENL